jgi:hypothetical protein
MNDIQALLDPLTAKGWVLHITVEPGAFVNVTAVVPVLGTFHTEHYRYTDIAAAVESIIYDVNKVEETAERTKGAFLQRMIMEQLRRDSSREKEPGGESV